MPVKFNPNKISELRDKLKMNQVAFAKQLGLQRQHVFNWEKGLALPNLGSIERLCNTFQVPPDFFFDHTGGSNNILTR